MEPVERRAPWWPEHVPLSRAQRALLAVIAVPVAGGFAVGLLGAASVLGRWAERVGAASTLPAFVLEVTPFVVYWFRRARDDGELHEKWQSAGDHLTAALDGVGLSHWDRFETEDFLRHNKLTSAFRSIVAGAAKGQAAVSADAQAHLAAAASDLGLDTDRAWRKLTRTSSSSSH